MSIMSTSCVISDFIKSVSEKYSEELAVSDSKGSYYYRDLEEYSNKVANYIVEMNVASGSIIGILMERSKESIAAMIGILKAGCTYMFIEREYPIERIQFMIKDADAQLVIVENNEMEHELSINSFVAFDEMISQGDSDYRNNEVASDVAAYVVYTSGSTGKPKGIRISNYNFIQLFETWGREHLTASSQNQIKTMVISPFAFDMSIFMILTSLMKGYHLHIIPTKKKQSGKEIVHYLNSNKIDIMDATPNYLRLNNEKLPHLKRVFCIGDVLSYSLVKDLIEYTDDSVFKLYNTYGPAECTILVTYAILDKNRLENQQVIPIGFPIKSVRLKIMDGHGQECNDEEVGELVIYGESVGLGYIGKKRSNDPFFLDSNLKKEHSYRTGDLVQRKITGEYLFIGRVDRQHKFNGYRIEIEEIERILEEIDVVEEARVVIKKEETGFSKMMVFYRGNYEKEKRDIRNHLKERLPYYMIPQVINYIGNKFPVNYNGKIDYHSLLQQVDRTSKNKSMDIQTYSKEMIKELLDREKLDSGKSFFELGGNSITLLSLVSSIKQQFELDIDISRIYSSVSIQALLGYLSQLEFSQKLGDESVPETSAVIIEPQKKLINLERKYSIDETVDIKAFSLIYKITFKQKIDTLMLNQAIQQVVKQNEVFYLSFQKKKNRYYMECQRNVRQPLIKSIDKVLFDSHEFSTIMLESSSYIEFIQNGEEELYVQVKHVLLDFISVQYLLNDITTIYQGNELKKSRTGFVEYLNINDDTKHLDYWKQQIEKNYPRSRLIKRDNQSITSSFAIKRAVCSQKLFLSLKKIAKFSHSSLFVVVLTIFIKILKEYMNTSKIRIGCYLPGRNYELDDGVLGMFTNVVPFIYDMKEKDEAHILKDVQETIIKMFQNQNVSMSKLYQLLPLEELENGELFDICFNYQNPWSCMENKDSPISRIETINIDPDVTKRDFYFGVIEENDQLKWEISYNQAVYQSTLIDDFIHNLEEGISYYEKKYVY